MDFEVDNMVLLLSEGKSLLTVRTLLVASNIVHAFYSYHILIYVRCTYVPNLFHSYLLHVYTHFSAYNTHR